MKRKLTKLMAAFALLVFMMPGLAAWGQQDLSFAPDQSTTGVNSTSYVASETEFTTNDVTFKINNWNPSSLQIRGNQTTNQNLQAGSNFYLHNTTAMPGNITGITITYTAGTIVNAKTYAMTSSAAITSQSIAASTAGTAGTNSVTWTFDGTSPFFAIGMEKGGTSGTTKCGTITITYATGQSETPSIAADAIEIAYDATEGYIDYTINNPADGTLSAATDADWITYVSVGAQVHFTCYSNDGLERTATITLTYTYNTNETVTKNVTVTQSGNPNAPGTQNNPYTVAQARAAIDANVGVTGVYATGIVSQIVTEFNSDYGNITFDMVDEEENDAFLRAYRCGGTEAANVQVGDIIVVYGNLTYFTSQSLYEFSQGCVVVSLEHPAGVIPSITANNVSLEDTDITGEIAYTVNNPVDGGTLAASTDADWIGDFEYIAGTNPNIGIVTFTCSANTETTARTATVTLTYTYSRETVTKDVTVTQAGYEAPHFTWDLSIASYNEVTDPDLVTWSSDYATMTNATGTGSTSASNYLGGDDNNRTSTRFYTNNLLTLTPSTGYAITSVVFTPANANQNYIDALVNSTWTNATAVQSGTTVVVTPTTGTDAIQAVVGGTCGFTGVTVYYVEDNSPTITANNVEIEYNATSGTITYTINNPAGGTTTASTQSNWLTDLTSGKNRFNFNCSENETATARTATVTLTYTYNTDQTVTKDVIVTQAGNPNYIMTIAEVRELSTGTTVTTKGIVTSCVGTTGYIQDATAAICVYGAELTVGDEIKVTGPLSDYNGLLEIGSTGTAATVDEVISQNNIVDPELMTIAEVNASTNQGWYVRIEDATVTAISGLNTTIAQGSNTIVVRGISGVEYAVNDILTLDGNIGCYNAVQIVNPQNVSVQHILVPSITVNPDMVEVDAEEHDGTLVLTYENLTITSMQDFGIQYYNAEGEEISEPDWIEVTVAEPEEAKEDGYVVSYYMIENETEEARTAYFKVFAAGEDFVYSNLVTVTQAAPVVPPTPGNWVLTTLADLTANDVFVIVGTRTDETYGGDYAMPNDNGTSAPAAVAITVVDGTLSGEPADNLKWNLELTNDGYVFYPNGDTEKWLYCTNTNNGVKVGTGDAKHFTLDDEFEGYLTTTETTDQRYIGIYNAQDWRCYKLGNDGGLPSNIDNQTFAFYKKVDDTPTETYPLEIEGYSTSENPAGGYYLIASPVRVNPAEVVGMTDDHFDLYYFDESNDIEWQNWKAEGDHYHFDLVPGKGYLYAHRTGGTFNLTGVPYTGDGVVTLTKQGTGNWAGWNLIGNPFGETAYIQGEWDFMVMNGDGSDLEAADVTFIERMQGVFVLAEADGDQLNLSTEAPGTPQSGKIVMNVSNNRGNNIDRAMIRFGEGRQLPKFMLNPNNTKLYIAQDGEDFSVVRSINENTTPVSFKAAVNGTYTLSVNVDNIEMEYLHLIDNMTGTDIDLLATPSYTFEASTTDYASRFNLIYATNDDVNENNTQSFAFFNGSEWVISNMGEATLQVVDVMGRVLRSEAIIGNANVNLNQSAGIYMLRLVNGNDVKVQKIVVR